MLFVLQIHCVLHERVSCGCRKINDQLYLKFNKIAPQIGWVNGLPVYKVVGSYPLLTTSNKVKSAFIDFFTIFSSSIQFMVPDLIYIH